MVTFVRANQIARANTLEECLGYVFLGALNRQPASLFHERHVSKIKIDGNIIFMWNRSSGVEWVDDLPISYERAEELIRAMWDERIIPYGCENDAV